jgi:ribosomal protein L37AE/L43A
MSEDPESCPCCNDHPAFEEIAEGEFQCANCNAVIRSDGTVIEEGEEPSPDTEDDLYDE